MNPLESFRSLQALILFNQLNHFLFSAGFEEFCKAGWKRLLIGVNLLL